jgi:hypothetical protein
MQALSTICFYRKYLFKYTPGLIVYILILFSDEQIL